jgi:DNA-binding transcriptional MerR regulator
MPRGRKRQVTPVDAAPSTRGTTAPPPATSKTIAFTPIDRGELWGRLRLNASQLAELTGVSLRQVMFWADRGYLPHVPGAPRTFSGVGLDTALLLAQARAEGVGLKRAAVLARQYLGAEFTGATRPAPPGPSALGTGLRSIEEAARALREQVAPEADGEGATG